MHSQQLPLEIFLSYMVCVVYMCDVWYKKFQWLGKQLVLLLTTNTVIDWSAAVCIHNSDDIMSHLLYSRTIDQTNSCKCKPCIYGDYMLEYHANNCFDNFVCTVWWSQESHVARMTIFLLCKHCRDWYEWTCVSLYFTTQTPHTT